MVLVIGLESPLVGDPRDQPMRPMRDVGADQAGHLFLDREIQGRCLTCGIRA